MITLMLLLYLMATVVASTLAVLGLYQPDYSKPTTMDRVMVFLVLPWGFVIVWLDGKDAVEWLAYGWHIVAHGEYLDRG
jgi:hypothetical protein